MVTVTKFVPEGQKKAKQFQLKDLSPGDGLIFAHQGGSLDDALSNDAGPAINMLTNVPSKDGQLTVVGIDGKGFRKVDETHLVTRHQLHIAVAEAETE